MTMQYAIGLVLATAASATAATMTLSNSDARVQTQLGNAAVVDETGNYACTIGEFYAPGGANYVMPFLLPTLPAGHQFASADLRLQLFELHGTPADADLYGLGARASSTVLASDYYQGVVADPSDATLLQQGLLTASSPLRTDANTGPFIYTSVSGNAALTAYLNAQYAGGAGAGTYVFLRLSPHLDTVPPGWNAYAVLTQDAGGAQEKPLLSYTTAPVPEPTALAGLVLSAGLLIRRRRTK